MIRHTFKAGKVILFITRCSFPRLAPQPSSTLMGRSCQVLDTGTSDVSLRLSMSRLDFQSDLSAWDHWEVCRQAG